MWAEWISSVASVCLGCLRSTKTTIAARTMVHPAQSTDTPFFTTSLRRTVGLQTNCTALLVRPTLTRLCVLSGLPLLRGQTRALSSLLPCQQRVCVRAVCAQQKQLHVSTVSADSATSNGRTRVAFATLASSVAATSRDYVPSVPSTPSRCHKVRYVLSCLSLTISLSLFLLT